MSQRPTPETDHQRALDNGDSTLALDFAERLERERDEAREQLNRICREGFGNDDTVSLEPCDDYVLRMLKQEREQAREAAKASSPPDPMAEAVQRMKAVPLMHLAWELHQNGGLEAVRARLIQAAKGEEP